jgi:hypothetical protein
MGDLGITNTAADFYFFSNDSPFLLGYLRISCNISVKHVGFVMLVTYFYHLELNTGTEPS